MTLGAWLNQKILEGQGAGGSASTVTQAGSLGYRTNEPPSSGPGLLAGSARYGEPEARPTVELGAVSNSIDALRRHLEDADTRAENTYGQVSRSLEAMLARLDEASARRRTDTGKTSTEGLHAIQRALTDVTQRLSAVEARRDSAQDMMGVERSFGEISRAFDKASAQTTQRIDQVERSVERVADQTERRDDRRMEAISGLERAVTEVVSRLDEVSQRQDDTSQQQTDAAREAERVIADLRDEISERDNAIAPAVDLLRERMFELSDQLESSRTAGREAVESKLSDVEQRIADALENTAKAEDLVSLESRVTVGATETVKGAVGALQRELHEDITQLESRVTANATEIVKDAVGTLQRDLYEELANRLDATETRNAKAVELLQAEIVEHLKDAREEPEAPAMGHNAPEMSEFEERIAARFDQMAAQFDHLARDIDSRIDRVGLDARQEIESLREEFGNSAPPEPVLPERSPFFDQEPPAPSNETAPDTPARETAPEEPEDPAPVEPEQVAASFAADSAGLREAAARPSETGVFWVGSDNDNDHYGVRTSIALFVIVLLLTSVGLIGYSGWRLWSQGQLDLSFLNWVLPEQSIEVEPARPSEPEPAEEPEAMSDPVAGAGPDESTLESTLAETETTGPEPETAAPVLAVPAPSTQTASEPAASEPSSVSEPATSEPAEPQAAAGGPEQLYGEALSLLETGGADARAAELLREAAEAGLTAAEFQLGALYEAGLGVPQDTNAARDWYERAAQGGNARAMHSLAILYADGAIGGAPSYAEAARWFAEAAAYDVRDSQYNLAVLFERGFGVRTDLRQAYLWYAIAERGGDTEAANRRVVLGGRLEENVRTRIDEAVVRWRPRPRDPEANGQFSISRPLGPSPAEIARTQYLLSLMGYDPGPADGVTGPRTTEAIRAFERTAGIAVTGRVTPELISRLEIELASRGGRG